MAIFTDIELVSIEVAEPPDAFAVAFDVIYPGETWCRSLVSVDVTAAVCLGSDEYAIVRAAEEALLDLLAAEFMPVSFHIRIGSEGVTVLARGTPGT